tara:strand:- start:129 stop:302 length:174 start_codon:yes stop_codon:yes gene_type:complete
MATRYKKYADGSDYKINAIQRILDDGTITSIPINEGNIDYKEYLEWVAEGNTAEAAD